MTKYYTKIAGEHHRFHAINIYGARQIAKSIARTKGVDVVDDPVIYKPNVHGEFWRVAA